MDFRCIGYFLILGIIQLSIGESSAQRFVKCTSSKAESGLCRFPSDCPENFREVITVRTKSPASSCPPHHVCCVFRGIAFPGANPPPQVTEGPSLTSPFTSLPVLSTERPIVPIPPDNYDISNPSLGSVLPVCGFRSQWSATEEILPYYEVNSSIPISPGPEDPLEPLLPQRKVRQVDPPFPELLDGFPDIGLPLAGPGGIDSGVNAWPWTALLGYTTNNGILKWDCGGSLINSQWIITAAHCFNKGFPVLVRLAEHDFSTELDNAQHQDFQIDKIEFYPEYSPLTAYHDLALIKIVKSINLTENFFLATPTMVPVCLPWGEEINAVLPGRKVLLTGWGATEFGGDLSSVLQVVPLTIFESSVCHESYSNLPDFDALFPRGITSNDFVCAGDLEGGKDACQGDSGAPIVYNTLDGFYITGIVSRGYGCGLKEFPGLYTPLHKPEYLHWIKKTAFN